MQPRLREVSLARRFFALVLDWVFVGLALLLMMGGIFTDEDGSTRNVIGFALVAAGLLGYFVLARVAWDNVTIGRRLLGMAPPPGNLEPASGQPPALSPPAPPTTPPPPAMPPPSDAPSDEGPGPASWGLLAPILFVAPLLLLLIPVALGGDSDEDSALTVTEAIVAQLLLSAYFAGTALAVSAGSGGASGMLGRLGLRRTSLMDFGAPAAAAGLYITFAIGYSLLLTLLGVSAEQEDVTQEFGDCGQAAGLIAAGLLIVVAAPVVEEVFFRGLLFGGLRRRMSFWPAALVSGLIFGSIHYTGGDSIGIVPQLAVFGIALAWVYERTRSLWFAIFLHAVNNALAFAVLAGECGVVR